MDVESINIPNCSLFPRCGTDEKCNECPIGKITAYLTNCSCLYTNLKGDDSGFKFTAQCLVDISTTNDLAFFGENWFYFYGELLRTKVSIKVRAGVRRGFDLLTVASMSRF
jgi:hypothetical protein